MAKAEKAGMPKQKIDRDKLRVHLRRLSKDALLDLLDRAVDLVPTIRLSALISGYLDPGDLAANSGSARRLVEAIEAFREASLGGDYYEDFAVNSKNFMETSRGTETWFAECRRLLESCVDAAGKGRHNEAREVFEILFDLLRNIDEGRDEIIFLADEGGSWQIGVTWEVVLPAYFTCLSATAKPGEYAEIVTNLVDDFVHYDRDKYLRKARGVATTAQKKLLR